MDMSINSKFRTFFGNHLETGEDRLDKSLKTRYYKAMKDKVFQTLENFFQASSEFEINSLSKERGEMSVITKKGKRAFIVVTVIMVSPNKTAVDFSVSLDSAIPLNFGYITKLINRLYDNLNKELPQL